jgi:pilus assembly protein CpaD
MTSYRICGGLLALGLALGGCNTDRALSGDPFPVDVRDRHPIEFAERPRALDVYVGSGHGRLTTTQRAQVAAFANAWRRESTGRLAIDVPASGRGDAAARHAAREISGVLAAMGVPHSAIDRRQSPAAGPAGSQPVRLAYLRVRPVTGPCGVWLDNIGPSFHTAENDPFWNHGCATQRNLAAMVANPEDLVQPRAETQPDATRRQAVMEKWRQGTDPSTTYVQKTDSKVSTVGQ